MKASAINLGTVNYQYAQELQQQLAEKRRAGEVGDMVLMLEHPPIVTVGRQGKARNILLSDEELKTNGITLHRTDRGGDVTYHGPGQLVVYPIFDLNEHGRDAHEYVRKLEEVGIRTLASFGHEGDRIAGESGVWCGKKKVASIGVALKNWITRHGMALNVDPDLKHFAAINPCGFDSSVMTSMSALSGQDISVPSVLPILFGHMADVFGLELTFSGVPAQSVSHPPWLRVKTPDQKRLEETSALLNECKLETVCREADCPNSGECFSKGVATFLILGANCTRKCRFCAVSSDAQLPVDPDEPRRLADASAKLGLDYVVVTSVTRDDLPDGGAAQFSETILSLRKRLPQTTVEVLIPDFGGNPQSLSTVLEARPKVLAHNMETIARLYDVVRPGAGYGRSLEVLARAKEQSPSLLVKSGFMVGLGENPEEVLVLMKDIRSTGCDILTIGQYLPPNAGAFPLHEYVTPTMFSNYEAMARAIGFGSVISGPLVRSSYAAAS